MLLSCICQAGVGELLQTLGHFLIGHWLIFGIHSGILCELGRSINPCLQVHLGNLKLSRSQTLIGIVKLNFKLTNPILKLRVVLLTRDVSCKLLTKVHYSYEAGVSVST